MIGRLFLPADAGRPLTPDERALAQGMFRGAIDYDRVRIHNRRWFPFQPKNVVMAPDGHLWFHPHGALICDDYCHAPDARRGMFIHEMTHVWQHQRGICLPLRRHPFCRYDYRITPGWRLQDYGLEQQAEIVRHAWMLRQGLPVPGAPPLSVYEEILPF